MFTWIKNLFKTENQKQLNIINTIQPTVLNRNWRKNMWVMTDKGIGIIFKLDTVCEIHLVDELGLTKEIYLTELNGLRQAKWIEIPEVRRGISEEEGKALGYGT